MAYPGFVTSVGKETASVFRDGYIFTVKNDIELEKGDWVSGDFDPKTKSISNMEKTFEPLKCYPINESFHFIAGYPIGAKFLKPFGKLDISQVPTYFKPNEFVTAVFRLDLEPTCVVTVEEVLFPHAERAFHPSSAIPVNLSFEYYDEMYDVYEGDNEDTNNHQYLFNDPKVLDPKVLLSSDESDDDIPINYDPIPAYLRKAPVLPTPQEEIPIPSPPRVVRDLFVPETYQREKNPQPYSVRKQISFTPSPTSSPSPVMPKRESAKKEKSNGSKFLMQKQKYFRDTADSSPALSSESEGQYVLKPNHPSAKNYIPFSIKNDSRSYSPKRSDDESSADEYDEHVADPVKDEESPFRVERFDFASDNDPYNVDSRAYDTENSDKSYSPLPSDNSDIGFSDLKNNKISSSDESLNFDGKELKEYMNDIKAWSHVNDGEKMQKIKASNNRHILIAKFDKFAVCYDSNERSNFGVIFCDGDNKECYDSLVVGGIYKGLMGEIFDNRATNGMPDLGYYLIRPEKVKNSEIHHSAIHVTMKRYKPLINFWTFDNHFTILDVDKFGSVALPTKYVHLLGDGAWIAGTAKFYVHPKITYYWSFVGDFGIFLGGKDTRFRIDESETFYYHLTTKYAKYLEVGGPEYYSPPETQWPIFPHLADIPSTSKVQLENETSKDAKPLSRRKLDALVPTFEYFQNDETSSTFAKDWHRRFEFY
uniref:Uncharacterized protein n=1 Tax=Panagrolaimus superbus TaxID=310955 RepID=A0A914ZEL2_9BILA